MIRIYLFICIVTISFSVQSNTLLPMGLVTNLNLNYRSPAGVGNAKKINLEEIGTFLNPKINFENDHGLILFNIDEFFIKLDLTMLKNNDLDSFSFDNFNYLNNESRLTFSLNSVHVKKTSSRVTIDQSIFDCQKELDYFDNIKDELLRSCLNNGSVKLINFSLVDSVNNKSNISLSRILLNIKDHKLTAEIKGKITKNVKVKIWGNSWYFPKSGEIKFKIKKVKAGFLNITNTLFKELKKHENAKLIVNKPYLSIMTSK